MLETFHASSIKKGKDLRRQRKVIRRKAIIILYYVLLKEKSVNNRIFLNILCGTAVRLCQ
jgi:hypothetical protein